MTAMTDRPLILVGGKGGVGKTTCSAALAARFAAVGNNTLVITSDMTPSLSDIFDRPVGDGIVRIAKNLSAMEIAQETIVGRWREKFGRDFQDILSHIVDVEDLDAESRHQLLDYIGSAPSLREETMLDLIVDTAEGGGFDRIVWDTAPAGETLNLLDMPRAIKKHLSAGAKVFEGLDKIGKQLIGKKSIADTMDEWIAASDRIARFINDHAAFLIVANPEALVVNHVRRLIRTLLEYRIVVQGMIINCVIENADSPILRALQKTQCGHIEDLRGLAGDRPVATLPLSLVEIKGMNELEKIGRMLIEGLML